MKKFILGTILLLCFAVTSYAKVIYVDKNMSDGFWSGSHNDLTEAIQSANSGDEIWVAVGTYHPGTNRSDSFILKPGVKLYGGFYGGEVAREDRDPYKNATVLSGDIGVAGNPEDNSYHVISYDGVLDQQTVIDGFTIRDGNAGNGDGGGGMLLKNGAAPLVRQCRFTANISSNGGGAVSLNNNVKFEYCLFDANSAEFGGAVFSPENRIEEGDASFSHCTFVSNTASEGSALYLDKREGAYIDSSVFWNNTDPAGNISTFMFDDRGGGFSSVTNTAVDDASVSTSTQSNIIYYSSTQADGPFTGTENFKIDGDHGIPQDWGWYYEPSPLVLNMKIFLEGAF